MKNYFKYMAILALGIVSCEPELENSIEDADFYSSGEADFSNYVALGNSLTAGYADGALYISGQENSYPNILAEKFAITQETNGFTQPLVNDNIGGLLVGGSQIAKPRYVLSVGANGPVPGRLDATPTTEVTNKLEGPFNNMGVPGAKSYHLKAEGYGSIAGLQTDPPSSNAYFARFSTSESTTVLADAMAQNPTFFTLWIGNNDVLGYATSGGTGTFQTNNTDVRSYGPNDITDPNAFAFFYSQIVEELAANAEGVLLNIPDITTVPYFTTIPNNALALDAATAANLTGFFQAVAGVMTQVLMQNPNVTPEQAQAIASQYAIQFNEGANRFLIDVPVTPTNPLGFRQMTEEELLLLPIDQSALAQGYGSVVLTQEVGEVLAILQAGGQPSQQQVQTLFGAVSGINDEDALDVEEIQNIRTATTAYNQAIESIATNFELGFVDANALVAKLDSEGIAYDGGVLTSAFVQGGAYSLDGIHQTPRGAAVIANAIIDEINERYGAEVPKANLGDYGTVTLEQNVQ
ncbi:SGNH/GDSL hydrolase family protein [Christiangramia crocea]|uniref:G-D-S-L family lipolytic protein n=1 Tax=Christiangramia crocea TaxID=2904124 RepID=A0A9X1UXT4_9FLAO|nr:SGNH/GDSL hydrolase family protein [Gramella crocea]MCG9971509.1 G-D-S-L family lipolytic protein [Gramella crocea]